MSTVRVRFRRGPDLELDGADVERLRGFIRTLERLRLVHDALGRSLETGEWQATAGLTGVLSFELGDGIDTSPESTDPLLELRHRLVDGDGFPPDTLTAADYRRDLDAWLDRVKREVDEMWWCEVGIAIVESLPSKAATEPRLEPRPEHRRVVEAIATLLDDAERELGPHEARDLEQHVRDELGSS